MQESQFIASRRPSWRRFEELLESNTDQETFVELFTEVSEDLAYARTYYPNRSVRQYLNLLVRKAQGRVYRNRFSGAGQIGRFWALELPSLMYHARASMLLALVLFALSFSIGAFSVVHESDFAEQILGSRYVSMTEQNIEEGDPMQVYKDEAPWGMFLRITWNNVRVAFLCFVSGLLAGIGTYFVLLTNGVMVGAFQFFFYQYGLLRESALTVWMHGVPEISAIVIASGAGFELGRAWLFPGSLPRLTSLQQRGRQALRIVFGLAPVFILAGFIEGFFTRETEVPDGLRLMFILTFMSAIIGYFGLYPYWLHQRGAILPPYEPRRSGALGLKTFTFREPESIANIIRLAISSLSRHFSGHAKWMALLALAIFLWSYQAAQVDPVLFNGPWYDLLVVDETSRSAVVILFMALLAIVALGGLIVHAFWCMAGEAARHEVLPEPESWRGFLRRLYGPVLVTFLILYLLTSVHVAFALLLPFMLLWICVAFVHQSDPFHAFPRLIALISSGFGAWLGMNLVLMALFWLVQLLLSESQLFSLLAETISQNIPSPEMAMRTQKALPDAFIAFIFGILVSILGWANAFFFFSQTEKQNPQNLLSQIDVLFPPKGHASHDVQRP